MTELNKQEIINKSYLIGYLQCVHDVEVRIRQLKERHEGPYDYDRVYKTAHDDIQFLLQTNYQSKKWDLEGPPSDESDESPYQKGFSDAIKTFKEEVDKVHKTMESNSYYATGYLLIVRDLIDKLEGIYFNKFKKIDD